MNAVSIKKSYELLYPLEFCVFDLESTGGNPKTDRIIEIGLVKIKNLKIVETKNYLINPEREIPEFIQKLTNIKPADVENAPRIEEVINDILLFIGDAILVAHNTAFDVPFLNAVLERLQIKTLNNKALCTNLMTKYMIPDLMSTNLQYMSQIFGFGHTNAHRALDDAKASAELLLKYLHVFERKNISKINSLYYPKNKFELDRLHLKRKDYKNLNALHVHLVDLLAPINSPFTISIKGAEGIILKMFPADGSELHKKEILKKISHIEVETITIKLSGPAIEGIIETLAIYQKLSLEVQKELMAYLNEYFLKRKYQTPLEEYLKHHLSYFLGDFIVFNHLIPEQIKIIPTDSLYQKMDLVLRYPGHANKLIQFLNSKTNRLSQGRLKKDNLAPEVKQFLSEYILMKKEAGFDVFTLKKIFNRKDFEAIKPDLDAFIEKNPNTFGYPNQFL